MKLQLLFISIIPILLFGQNIKFPPTPIEDTINGKNDNCYLVALGHPSEIEKREFINSLKIFIDSISLRTYLPQKTIMAMAILESGFGFTRIGYFANNLFGIKLITTDSLNAYVLKGQPDENNGKNIRILKRTKNGQLIFDEKIRTDNRYRKFKTKQECILYLTTTLLQKNRYKPASTNFINNLKKGISEYEASLIYAFEIANKGYNQHGGKYYRNGIEKVIKQYKL